MSADPAKIERLRQMVDNAQPFEERPKKQGNAVDAETSTADPIDWESLEGDPRGFWISERNQFLARPAHQGQAFGSDPSSGSPSGPIAAGAAESRPNLRDVDHAHAPALPVPVDRRLST